MATEAHEAEGEKTKGDEPETKTQRGWGRVREAQESFGSASEDSLKMSDLGRRMSRTIAPPLVRRFLCVGFGVTHIPHLHQDA